ncbi:transmembrane protein 42 [Protopterus annectens]|uniref:transmembrane protein 42 n=1 Tax=Protopterus annectens TaxID=7888 RepID=UPI001CFBD9C0|nr:transmembrane protein 42 [Protopterus annectens]
MVSGTAFSVVAGLFGALASSSAKLAVGADYVTHGCKVFVELWLANPHLIAQAAVCSWLPVLLRLGCGGMVITFNAVMWTFFAKALRYSASSARATVTSAASNYISSAILGKALFGESHALLWWVGISLILCGLLLLHTATSRADLGDTERKEK